ncbi:hypothetical protein B0A54_17584 [Friedmanniomyces endolithicus]|uniref:Uncharacterized protein n=1 Tax=Friedmanniomyces endolithicus TaxID=329885 RepID=A0A4U0TUX6_9PEZI|nr:hypothetical protein LTS09_017142 [Friedmanniomyces endolithicus]TKA25796.1 hypothetical protein B0A54_17584 [Friedmanniomyces endolithicus]
MQWSLPPIVERSEEYVPVLPDARTPYPYDPVRNSIEVRDTTSTGQDAVEMASDPEDLALSSGPEDLALSSDPEDLALPPDESDSSMSMVESGGILMCDNTDWSDDASPEISPQEYADSSSNESVDMCDDFTVNDRAMYHGNPYKSSTDSATSVSDSDETTAMIQETSSLPHDDTSDNDMQVLEAVAVEYLSAGKGYSGADDVRHARQNLRLITPAAIRSNGISTTAEQVTPASPEWRFHEIVAERHAHNGKWFQVVWCPSWVHESTLGDIDLIRYYHIVKFGKPWAIQRWDDDHY